MQATQFETLRHSQGLNSENQRAHTLSDYEHSKLCKLFIKYFFPPVLTTMAFSFLFIF